MTTHGGGAALTEIVLDTLRERTARNSGAAPLCRLLVHWAVCTVPLADPYLSTAIILAETLIFPPIMLVER